jgi:hypothetical protein
MPKPDFPPAFLAAFLHARNEFAKAVPLGSVPQGIAFGDFQLFRIAEALEALVDTEITRGVEETVIEDREPWQRDNGEDDE